MEKDREYEGLLVGIGEEEFLDLSSSGRAYVFEERREIIGVCAAKDATGADLGVKESEYNDLLFDLNWNGERVLALRYIGIDPRFQHRGVGGELLAAALGRFPHCSFLCLIQKEDERAISLFQKKGFVKVKSQENGDVYAKMYIQPGLCRNIGW